jgi:hypothetical protein
MSDNSTLTLEGLAQMGAGNYRGSGDRTTGGITSVEPVSTPPSSVGFSGDVDRPTMVPAMTADEAAAEHTKLATMMADVDTKLAAQKFDPKTGKPTGYVAEGRERELLANQKQSFQNAIDYLGVRAKEMLPRRGAAQEAADQALIDGVQRERNIAALASERDSTGRELGRLRAAALIDEAMMKDRAAALVRGGR